MRVTHVAIGSLPIPFRQSFRHAAAVRSCAENVIVLVKDNEGRIGVGEGCPRSYVTGETVASALQFLERVRAGNLSSVDGPAVLDAWMEKNAREIDANPAAFCSLELALLDLFARQRGLSLEEYLGIPVAQPLMVSAVYGSGRWSGLLLQAALFSIYRLSDAKLKLTGNSKDDGARARMLARLGKVRADANNLWPDWATARAGLVHVRRYAWAVEEPLHPRDWPGMVQLATSTGLSIILDESLTSFSDLDAVPTGAEFILNLRVSKLGGLLRTLRVVSAAKARGFKIIIGAQVGETSILARAGLIAASAAGAALCGYEGGYGTWLLSRDAVTPSLDFRYGGRVSPRLAGLEEIGTGLHPTKELLRCLR